MLIFTKGTLAEIRAICIHLDKIWFNHLDKQEDVDRNNMLTCLEENAQKNEQTSAQN